MEGVVQIQTLELDRAPSHRALESLQILKRPRHCDGFWCVFSGNNDANAVNPGFTQERFHFTESGGDSRHAAHAAGRLLVEATQANDAHGGGQRERSASPSSGDLAKTVPDDCGRLHAARGKGFHNSHLQGEDQRLDKLRTADIHRRSPLFKMRKK